MDFPPDQVSELKQFCSELKKATEGGVTYFLLCDLAMPEGRSPARVDALLCPTPRDGYPSRLFVPEPVTGAEGRNWNASNVRILEHNWFAVSWRVNANLRLAQMVAAHLEAFR